MLIGMISDTHDNLDRTKAAVDVFRRRAVKCILHCGDIISPFVVPLFNDDCFEKCVAVFGNNDGEWLFLKQMFEPVGELLKPPAFFEVGGYRIALLHEPMPDDVMAALPVDLVAFGHTHDVVAREGKPIVINPGECCGYLTGKCTVGIVDMEKRKAEIIELGAIR